MQISSNHSIPGAISYPFILSEHYPFRPPQKAGGAMIQKSVTEQMINIVLTTTRKALSQQISLSIFLVMGMDILTTLATLMKPRLWLFQYLNQLARYLTPIAVGSGHTEHRSALYPCGSTFHQWPLLGSKMIELTLFHGSFFLSISLQVMHDSIKD